MRSLRKLGPVVAGAGFALAIAYLVISLVTTLGDNDKYGKVRAPGEGVVHLPAGDVVLYYEARLGLPSDSSIDKPDDLEVRVRSRDGGEDVPREDAGHLSSYQMNNLDGTSVYKLKVPSEGDYGVVVRGGSGPDAAVTFGPYVGIGGVLGRSGLIIVAGLLLGAVMWRVGKGRSVPPTPAGATPVGPVAPVAPAPQPAPVPEPAPAATPPLDPQAELAELKAQRDSGQLSESEFQARRDAVLDRL